jgi:DNA-binding beta-propeller fold protein YncE
MHRLHPAAGKIVLLTCALIAADAIAEPVPLSVEAKIALPGVKGRIDHLAVDVAQQRLFIAALGNGSVEVVDLTSRQRVKSVQGFDEPQGVALLPRTQTLYVASGGDGSLRTLPLSKLTPDRTIDLGADADNVRIDREQRFVYVGYGAGALAVIDAWQHSRIADIRLAGHPESFQLETSGRRIFVNVPDANQIAVVDREARQQIASWPTRDLHANFAMALDERAQRLLVSFRRPAMLGVFDLSDGKELTRIETCGDVDDVFVDRKRGRVYVVCGEGFVDVLAEREGSYSRVGRLPTSPGARTALFSAELDRLFVAARASGSEPATAWVLRN